MAKGTLLCKMVQEVLSGRPHLSRGWSGVMMMKQSRKQLGKAFLTKGGQEPRGTRAGGVFRRRPGWLEPCAQGEWGRRSEGLARCHGVMAFEATARTRDLIHYGTSGGSFIREVP